MKTFPIFNKSLPNSAALLGALFLSPQTGMAQYAGARVSRVYNTENSEMIGQLGQIGYTTMLCFIGAIVVIAFGFIFYMAKSYTELSKPKKLNRSLFAVLMLGLGTFGSSCSPAQKARAEQYRKAMEAAQRSCPLKHQSIQADASLNNFYTYNGYSIGHDPSFCPYCGKRIVNNRY